MTRTVLGAIVVVSLSGCGQVDGGGGVATTAHALTSTLTQTLAGRDTNVTSSHFATSLAASGKVMVAGTPWAAGVVGNAGAAYVFGLTGKTWAEEAKLAAVDGVATDDFGDAVATDGTTIVVGDPTRGDAGANAGAAYVFVKVGSTWSPAGKLAPADPAANARFGTSVAVAGNRVLVGAPGHGSQGAVYVFERATTTWAQTAKLQAPAGTPLFVSFGRDVALSGDVAVVGAPSPGFGDRDGEVHEFVVGAGGWAHRTTIIAPDGFDRDHFGAAVAIDAGTLVVGAHAEDDRPDLPEPKLYGTGAAYVYARSGTSYVFVDKLLPPPGTHGEQNTACCGLQDFMFFGIDVAVAGARIIVGASQENAGIERSGAAYVYERVGTTITLAQRLPPAQLFQTAIFGQSLAVANDWLIVGAPGTPNAGALGAGVAYVYELDGKPGKKDK